MTDRDEQGLLSRVGLAAIGVGFCTLLAGSLGVLPGWLLPAGWLSAPLVAALFLCIGVAVGLKTRTRHETVPETPAGAQSTPTPTQLGDSLEAALEDGDEAGVRAALRQTAVTVLALRTGCSRADAAATLQAGTWTRDRIAAATVGGEEAPSFRPDEQLLATLLPRRTLRARAERTIAAIEAIDPTDTPGDQTTSTATSDGAQSPSSDPDTADADPETTSEVPAGESSAASSASEHEPQPAAPPASEHREESSERVEGSLDA